MILRTTGKDIAEQAITGSYVGIPYSKLDCQGFVEQVLKDLGVRKPDGSVYNWRGSNSMWRNFISWRGSIKECKEKFGEIPVGAIVFIIKYDGGEKEKGYQDDLGNASHVGLYLGTYPMPCMDSQGNRGVDYCSLNVFTHVGLMSMVDYYNEPIPPEEEMTPLEAVRLIREDICLDSEYLKALETLTIYMRGV